MRDDKNQDFLNGRKDWGGQPAKEPQDNSFGLKNYPADNHNEVEQPLQAPFSILTRSFQFCS
jgi:hypothetical protein